MEDVDGERLPQDRAGEQDEIDTGDVQCADQDESSRQPQDAAQDSAFEYGVERGTQDHKPHEAVDTAAGRPHGQAEVLAVVSDHERRVADRLSDGQELQRCRHGVQGDVGRGSDGRGQEPDIRVGPRQEEEHDGPSESPQASRAVEQSDHSCRKEWQADKVDPVLPEVGRVGRWQQEIDRAGDRDEQDADDPVDLPVVDWAQLRLQPEVDRSQ